MCKNIYWDYYGETNCTSLQANNSNSTHSQPDWHLMIHHKSKIQENPLPNQTEKWITKIIKPSCFNILQISFLHTHRREREREREISGSVRRGLSFLYAWSFESTFENREIRREGRSRSVGGERRPEKLDGTTTKWEIWG